jgi:hypothetical protein
MGIVGQGLHNVRAGPNELPVQLAQGLRIIEHYLWNIRPSLEVSAALKLEEIAFCTEH